MISFSSSPYFNGIVRWRWHTDAKPAGLPKQYIRFSREILSCRLIIVEASESLSLSSSHHHHLVSSAELSVSKDTNISRARHLNLQTTGGTSLVYWNWCADFSDSDRIAQRRTVWNADFERLLDPLQYPTGENDILLYIRFKMSGTYRSSSEKCLASFQFLLGYSNPLIPVEPWFQLRDRPDNPGYLKITIFPGFDNRGLPASPGARAPGKQGTVGSACTVRVCVQQVLTVRILFSHDVFKDFSLRLLLNPR